MIYTKSRKGCMKTRSTPASFNYKLELWNGVLSNVIINNIIKWTSKLETYRWDIFIKCPVIDVTCAPYVCYLGDPTFVQTNIACCKILMNTLRRTVDGKWRINKLYCTSKTTETGLLSLWQVPDRCQMRDCYTFFEPHLDRTYDL